MSKPDWKELQAVGQEADRLQTLHGALTPVEYERLVARARVAAAGFPLLEFIANYNPNPPKR